MASMVLGLALYWIVNRRKEIQKRDKYFKRNGGLLLAQDLSTSGGVIEKARIFTENELKKATDDFNDNRVIGQGGQGTVYKGILTDGRIVAIKKSKKVNDRQLAQFMNEVVVLSQINHRHVVKLLGCCLETKIPLLVYEFITNGTLSENLHNSKAEFKISWKMRLQIAAESAGAIAYLHSFSSTPILHRDIKSSNILLDDKFKAKVSDFGTSRTIAIEQTHFTTQVLGTFGYLDPEYFRSGQLTDKSDVYSFGVVLIELLTSRKPVSAERYNETRCLTTEFLYAMRNSCLLDMLDPQVVKEAQKTELMTVAELARECVKLKGKKRPTAKEVAMVLEGLISGHRSSSEQKVLLQVDHVAGQSSELNLDTGPLYSRTFSSYNGDSSSFDV